MKKIIFIVIAFCCIHHCYSQAKINVANTSLPLQQVKPEAAGFSSERLKRIDNNIMQWVNDGHTTGAVALIVRNGKIVYHKAFGYDALEKTKPMRTDNIFRIASQTKAITSVAVMMLYEEGKFLLDDPVSRYIPEFAKQQVLDSFIAKDSSYTTIPAKSEVTIRQLLTHTSGIGYAQFGNKEAIAIFAKGGLSSGLGVEQSRRLEADIKKIGKLPLMHQPGERFTYGLNTDVLGYLVEVTSGMSLDQFFKTRIFEPLGMHDTYFYLPESKYNRLVTLHEEVDHKLQKASREIKHNGILLTDYPVTKGTYFSGGAGLSSTALDYAIFLQMLLNGGQFNGKRLLSRNAVRMMTMNQIADINFGVNKMGLGFGITSEKGSSILPTPEGVFEWAGGFATHYWADPKENLIGILYRQIWNTTQWEAGTKFKVLVYQALND
ncbi:MAG TPA: serine hydrolase [Chitinophagaceae bacterium]|nr:serine hydrolase [Chitinophagaceae bacterium]